jgi:indole-3-glycerol phosphate synthase
VQAFSQWAPPGGTLGRIVAEAHERVAVLRGSASGIAARAAAAAPAPSMADALRGDLLSVIAEVKRSSPSKGAIRPGLDAGAQARAYEAGGARAISVLTEPRHFGGTAEDLAVVRGAVALPALRKDFHVDPLQLAEARALGASAVLLIARALDPESLAAMAEAAHELGLEVLVEVRDEWELERAVRTGARMIGVNNRNLETLAIDLEATDRLIPGIPADRIAVAESGIATPADVQRAADAGADAVLVGSSISAAADPRAATRALAGIRRRAR